MRGQRQAESSKIRLGMQVDDATFRSMIVETGVLNSKEHSKWRLDILIDLFEGPLLNPKRMEEAIRGLKFFRKLMPFFHPLERRYSDIEPSNVSSTTF